ncbi:MAG: hypothetical protein ABI893_12410, partial [Polaromonas sp.]
MSSGLQIAGAICRTALRASIREPGQRIPFNGEQALSALGLDRLCLQALAAKARQKQKTGRNCLGPVID